MLYQDQNDETLVMLTLAGEHALMRYWWFTIKIR